MSSRAWRYYASLTNGVTLQNEYDSPVPNYLQKPDIQVESDPKGPRGSVVETNLGRWEINKMKELLNFGNLQEQI